MSSFFKLLRIAIILSFCYKNVELVLNTLQMMEYSTWVDPDYATLRVFMVDSSLNMDVNLFKEVPDLSVHILAVERNKNMVKKLHDRAYKFCDIKNQIGINPLAFLVHDILRKYANFTIACSYSPGFYVIRNVRPGTAGTPLAFVHKLNSIVTANVTLFNPDKPKGIAKLGAIIKIIKA